MLHFPSQFTQGDRVSWVVELLVFDPNTDTLSCFIRGNNSALDLTAVASGNAWQFTITEAESMALMAGKYKAQLVIFPISGRRTLGTFDLTVCSSLETLTELDITDQDEAELKAVTIAIAKIVSGGVAEYQIKGRRVTYQDLGALTERQRYLRNRLAKKKNKSSIGGRNVGITFGEK